MRSSIVAGSVLALFAGCAAALADVVPIARSSTLSTSWVVSNAPFPADTGGAGDTFNGLGYYSNAIDGNPNPGTIASQTSYLLTDGAYAQVGGHGYQGTSVMHPTFGSGMSEFIFTFSLTSPTTMFFTGLLSRETPFVALGTVRLFDVGTNAQLYAPSLAGLGSFDIQRTFADSLALGVGTYRLEVRGGNNGAGGGAPNGSTMAQVFMTTPTPGAAPIALLGGLVALRRRRR